MRFLLRIVPASADREATVEAFRGIARSLGSEFRNPKWTSYGALELDAFTPSKADFELILAALRPLAKVEFTHDLNVPPKFMADAEVVEEARGYFDAERYWECHETLEGLWRNKVGEERSFLQGVILVCAAFVHFQKGEENVALKVLERGEKQLSYPSRDYHGVSVSRLKGEVERILLSRQFRTFRL